WWKSLSACEQLDLSSRPWPTHVSQTATPRKRHSRACWPSPLWWAKACYFQPGTLIAWAARAWLSARGTVGAPWRGGADWGGSLGLWLRSRLYFAWMTADAFFSSTLACGARPVSSAA